MQSVYAVYGSKLHLILEDEFADAYNRAHEKYIEYGKDKPSDFWKKPIALDLTAKELHAFNTFAKLMNFMIEINGGDLDLTEEEITSDYLVKIES
jgi:hypothetical protein